MCESCVVSWVLHVRSGLTQDDTPREPSVGGCAVWLDGAMGGAVLMASGACVLAVVKRDEHLDALMDQFDKELEADALKVPPLPHHTRSSLSLSLPPLP